MKDNKKTKVSIYKLDISEYIEGEYFYAYYIQRRDMTIYPSRWYMVVVLKEKDIGNVKKIKKLEKSHLYLNPLSIWNFDNMGEKMILWEKIGEQEINIDIIETWSFKKYGISMIKMTEDFLNRDGWDIYLNDNRCAMFMTYHDEWNNLDFAGSYVPKNIAFRVALEYCRINKITYEEGIKNFNRKFKNYDEGGFLDLIWNMDRILYNMDYIKVYQNLPDEEKGVCLYLPEDVKFHEIDVERELSRKSEWDFSLYFKEDEDEVESEDEGLLLIFRINDQLEPIDADEVYEEKLAEFFEENGYGFCSGGGTMLDDIGNVQYIELEVELEKEDEGKIPEIIKKLEELGAPKGSKMYIEGKKRVKKFGKKEGVQILVNKDNSEMPPQKIAMLYQEIKEMLKEPKEINRIAETEEDFIMYFYGDSYRQLKKSISDHLKEKGINKWCKIVKKM